MTHHVLYGDEQLFKLVDADEQRLEVGVARTLGDPLDGSFSAGFPSLPSAVTFTEQGTAELPNGLRRNARFSGITERLREQNPVQQRGLTATRLALQDKERFSLNAVPAVIGILRHARRIVWLRRPDKGPAPRKTRGPGGRGLGGGTIHLVTS